MDTYYSQLSYGLDDEIDMDRQLIEQEERVEREIREEEYAD